MRRLSPTARCIDSRTALLLALLAPALCAEPANLAASLWQDGDAAGYCAGIYAGPAVASADSDATVRVNARTLHSLVGGVTTAAGGALAQQGDRQLTTSALVIDEPASVVRADSTMRLDAPGLHVVGQRAVVGLRDDSAHIEDGEFVLTGPQLRGVAARIDRGAATLRLSATSLTRCPPTRDTWRLYASTIDFREGALFATARHARIVLGRVPVFYSPYLRFPVTTERASGFLFPNASYDGENGLDVGAPYYLNLAPNYDATLAPRYITNRGAGLEAEFRHLGRRSRNALGGAFLSGDESYNGELPRADFFADGAGERFAPADRWLTRVSHHGRLGHVRTRLDYTAVSDNDYFLDLGADLAVSSRVLLQRRGEIQYSRGELFARLWAQSFQRLEPGLAPYRRLPEANVTYAGSVWGPLQWNVGGAWSSFRRSSSASAKGLAAVVGSRLHLEPRLRLPLARPWGFLTLSAGVRHTGYDLANTSPRMARAPTRTLGVASVDGGIFLERSVRGGQWIQTLSPRLYYLYQSYAAQHELPRFDAARLTFAYRQLFRDNRFAGLDRLGDANQLAAGVTSRLLTAASGRELLAASVGAIAYLQDRRVVLSGRPTDYETQPTSALAAELRSTLAPVRAAATLAWNPHDGVWEEAGLALSYRRDARRLLNVGYRRRMANNIHQTDLSFHWPLATQWDVFGRWNHDWRHGQIIEAFAGVGYANCCLDVKVLLHRTVDVPRNRLRPDVATDSGVLLQLAFRGLAGLGTKVDSRLARGIKGYKAIEER